MDEEDHGAAPAGGGAPGGGRGPRPRNNVNSGWGFDGGGDGQGAGALNTELSPSNARPKNRHFEKEEEDVVPTIPDLEEEADEDITRQVAAPPTAAGTAGYSQPVRSVRELDNQAEGRLPQLPASPEEGVDLAPLMQCLCSERQVYEVDQTWDHQLIFQEVASAINADLAAEEAQQTEENTEQLNGR
eukprot:TRINITY_DN63057_c0_g1_i1.p1 TRINITY_DN63057_c0_g1~~TRINITY_DN63057_c0_g1_i1.p1  ORF type:complete len:187 (-),score=52.90 TRINITY_DN63057_c0_g1_i1:137-697(-)